MKTIILGLLIYVSLTQAKDLQYEIGLGVPYGGIFGVNTNYEVNDNFDAFIGLGATPSGLGYSIGTRYYVTNHIRLTGAYGTNAIVETFELIGSTLVSSYDSHEGLSFGVGYYFSKEEGFVIDLIYLATVNTPNDVEDATGIKFSLGYRF